MCVLYGCAPWLRLDCVTRTTRSEKRAAELHCADTRHGCITTSQPAGGPHENGFTAGGLTHDQNLPGGLRRRGQVRQRRLHAAHGAEMVHLQQPPLRVDVVVRAQA